MSNIAGFSEKVKLHQRNRDRNQHNRNVLPWCLGALVPCFSAHPKVKTDRCYTKEKIDIENKILSQELHMTIYVMKYQTRRQKEDGEIKRRGQNDETPEDEGSEGGGQTVLDRTHTGNEGGEIDKKEHGQQKRVIGEEVR